MVNPVASSSPAPHIPLAPEVFPLDSSASVAAPATRKSLQAAKPMGKYQVGFRPFRHDVRWRDAEYSGRADHCLPLRYRPRLSATRRSWTRGTSSKARGGGCNEARTGGRNKACPVNAESGPGDAESSPGNTESSGNWDSLERTLFDLEVATATRHFLF